jgi:hypothetical protein
MPFAISIAVLSLMQAALVALPHRAPWEPLAALRSRWWSLLPPASIGVVIALVGGDADFANALTYIALVGVPPLAALALAVLMRGARPAFAVAAIPLFALAWAARGSLAGEGAALALSALACVTLGWLLVSVAPRFWLKVGIYAMAAVDTWLVASDLLQAPNSVLTVAAPAIGLPRLQVVFFGSATMGFGDLFIAATLGALLAGRGRRQLEAAALAAICGLAFDLLFFFASELPATVPIAITLALVELLDRRGRVPVGAGTVRAPDVAEPLDRIDGSTPARPAAH